MPDPRLSGPTAYETWVRTLRAWALDPTTPLGHLPRLEDDTYTPETYARLFAYITAALSAATERWSAALVAASTRAKDPHDLARELQQLRPVLARRVQLARLQAHPPGVRVILEEELRSTITRLQAELEDNVRRQTERARLDHGTRDRLLRVVRENSFTAVLSWTVDARGEVSAPVLEDHAPTRMREGSEEPSRWTQRRRINVTPQQEG